MPDSTMSNVVRVLVVDDFQMNLDTAMIMLKKLKLQADCVTNGQEAINRIQNGEPVYSAVLMDHVMPEMDGMETTRHIRSLDTDYAKTIPIIAVTADDTAGNEQMFLENGFQAFISKPLSMAKLDSIIKEWIHAN